MQSFWRYALFCVVRPGLRTGSELHLVLRRRVHRRRRQHRAHTGRQQEAVRVLLLRPEPIPENKYSN